MRHYICDRCKKEYSLEGCELNERTVLKKSQQDDMFIIEYQTNDGWEYIDLCPKCEKELMKWLLGETE